MSNSLPWRKEEIPAWAEFLAQDADCTWWACEAHPNEMHNDWYENEPAQAALWGEFRRSQNEVGRIQRLGKAAAPADCHATLISLAGYRT